MDKIIEFICDELEELEQKVKRDGKLSTSEIEFGKELSEWKKDILKGEMLYEESEYSNANRGSYARNGRGRSPVTRDRYGRYSGEGYSRNYSMGDHSYDGVMDHLEKMVREEPNEYKRKEIEKFIDKMERM